MLRADDIVLVCDDAEAIRPTVTAISTDKTEVLVAGRGSAVQAADSAHAGCSCSRLVSQFNSSRAWAAFAQLIALRMPGSGTSGLVTTCK